MNTIETEYDLVNYLQSHPDFFHRFPNVLSNVKVVDYDKSRAVHEHDRQVEILRERVTMLEKHQIEMMRFGNENTVLFGKILRWASTLLLNHNDFDLPKLVISSLECQFSIPQAALRVWQLSKIANEDPCSQNIREEDILFAESLNEPFCGPNTGFDVASSFQDPASAASIAFIPLRTTFGDRKTFGLLLLASSDAARFSRHMGIDYLASLGEIASSALLKLR
jgi:uncharacterized protein